MRLQSPASDRRTADLLIVGSGIMGAVVAQRVREVHPDLSILMVDGGSPIGATPGLHLHDVTEPEIWEQYNARVASGIQGFYAGAEPVESSATEAGQLAPGIHQLAALGEDTASMPASSAAWNVGGMGAHWTAATPWPAGDETFDFGDPGEWQRDLSLAQAALGVTPEAIGPTRPGSVVLEVLADRFGDVSPADRLPQLMPMAVTPSGGILRRSGPSTIFPPIGGAPDPHFELLSGTLATSIEYGDGTATGVVVRDVATGSTRILSARQVIVCADVFRTPQLLFASGIRPPALGRYLNEHAFITGRVLMDLDRFGLERESLPLAADGEFCTDSLWLPQNGEAQPFHGQIMDSTYLNEEGKPLAHAVGLSLYSPVESRAENRIRFDEEALDLMGMPRFEIDFAYSPRDVVLIEQAHCELDSIAQVFGAFDRDTESALLPAGSSLHHTGTVRMGIEDDGTSVCDPSGRVWGFDNLYVAGNGAIPTSVVGNSTLTGTITAIRAARAIAHAHAPVTA